MKQHVREQVRSAWHRMAILYFPIMLFLGYYKSTIFIVGMIIFFLITSFPFLKSMLFYLLILTGAMIVFPPLAPFILIAIIIFFMFRIHFIYENWRPFFAGLILYGTSFLYIYKLPELVYLFPLYSIQLYTIQPFMFAFIGFLVIRQLLVWLYRHGYSSQTALSLMGSVPLVLISFILPFLKLHMDMFLFEGKAGTPIPESAKPVPTTKTEFVDPHYVRGYYRADGTYVEGYWRDGDGDTSIDLSKEEGGGYIRRRNL